MRYLLQLDLRLPGVAGFLGRTGGMTGVGGDGGSLRGGGTSGLAGAGVLLGILPGSVIGSLIGFWRRSGTSCGTKRGGIIEGVFGSINDRSTSTTHNLIHHNKPVSRGVFHQALSRQLDLFPQSNQSCLGHLLNNRPLLL